MLKCSCHSGTGKMGFIPLEKYRSLELRTLDACPTSS
ncbi:hypothetical protein RSAG8_08363, partial [Rhizoctonia solani AG-8 WAC10335]